MNRELRKFAGTLFLFAVALAGADATVSAVCGWLWNKMPDSGERVAKSNYVVNRQQSDLLIVGSSRAECHYDTDLLSDSLHCSAFNAGGDGQDLVYTLAIIRSAIERSHPPRCIAVDINPWDLYEKSPNLALLYPQYRRHPAIRRMIDENIPHAGLKMHSGFYRYNQLFGRIVRSLFYKADGSQDKGYLLRPVREWDTSSCDSTTYTGTLSAYRIATMEETAAQCRTQGIRLIFVISPIYWHYGSSESNRALRQIAQCLDVPLLDYSRSEVFVHRPALFYDALHLNRDGTALFTHLFASDLRRLISQPQPVSEKLRSE